MTHRSKIPLPLLASAFRTGDALAAEVSASRLRSDDLDRSYWGIRSATELLELADRCRALQMRLPADSFVSHSTAAMLHGMPVPLRLEMLDELHVTVVAPNRAPHANRLKGHRTSAPVRLIHIEGVRVSDAARTWCDLAHQVATDHLVAAGDYLLHGRLPLSSLADLMSAASSTTNRRGRRRIVEALHLLDGRAESAQESRLRVLLVTNGFTDLVINHHVEDRFGEFVARTDIFIPALGIVLEYMGDYHRTTPGQWRADMTRRSKIEVTGRRVMELNADDLRDPKGLMARIWALAALVPR